MTKLIALFLAAALVAGCTTTDVADAPSLAFPSIDTITGNL